VQPPVLYAPPENIQDGLISLPKTEAHHAASVMRLKRASLVIVVDGLGTAYRSELVHVTGKKVIARIHAEQRNFGEPGVRLTLASGLSAGHKFDTTVEKGTELGVKRFVPILAERSKVRMDDPKRAGSRVKRLERVALAAMKQCRRSYRPDIALPTNLSAFLREQEESDLKLLFHLSPQATALEQIDGALGPKRITVLIGPESGFSGEEVDQACCAGFRQVGLGQRILRTETAGPVAVALLLQRLGEFS
jgi:16S rRNA (uracil1498-N3)-methyltransferase